MPTRVTVIIRVSSAENWPVRPLMACLSLGQPGGLEWHGGERAGKRNGRIRHRAIERGARVKGELPLARVLEVASHEQLARPTPAQTEHRAQHDRRLLALVEFDLSSKARTTIASGLPVGAPPGVEPKPLKGMPPFSGPQGPFAGVTSAPDGTLYVSADSDGSVLAIGRR